MTRRRFATISMLLGLVVLSSAEAAPIALDTDLHRVGLHRFWEADLSLPQGDVVEHAYLVDDMLYVVSHAGNFFALQAADGLLRWSIKLTEPGYRVYAPSHMITVSGLGSLLAPTTTELNVLDRHTGARLRRFVPPFPSSSTVIGAGNFIFMGGADAKLYSFALEHPRSTHPVQNWVVATDAAILASPRLYRGFNLLFASSDGQVYSCSGRDKRLNWKTSLGGGINGDPAINGDSVFIANTNRSLYRLDLSTGQVVWRLRMPGELHEGPLVAGGMIFQYGAGFGLTAVDADTGQERWCDQSGMLLLAHDRSRDFVLTNNLRMHVLDHESGSLIGDLDLGSAALGVANAHSDAVFLLTRDGGVVCFRADRVPYLRRQQILAARALLNTQPGQADDDVDSQNDSATDVSPTQEDPFRSRRDRKP